jgi:hypothetical protein
MPIQNAIFGTFVTAALGLALATVFAAEPTHYGLAAVTFALLARSYDPAT